MEWLQPDDASAPPWLPEGETSCTINGKKKKEKVGGHLEHVMPLSHLLADVTVGAHVETVVEQPAESRVVMGSWNGGRDNARQQHSLEDVPSGVQQGARDVPGPATGTRLSPPTLSGGCPPCQRGGGGGGGGSQIWQFGLIFYT